MDVCRLKLILLGDNILNINIQKCYMRVIRKFPKKAQEKRHIKKKRAKAKRECNFLKCKATTKKG